MNALSNQTMNRISSNLVDILIGAVILVFLWVMPVTPINQDFLLPVKAVMALLVLLIWYMSLEDLWSDRKSLKSFFKIKFKRS